MRPLHTVTSFPWILGLILLTGCGGGGSSNTSSAVTATAALQASVTTQGNFTSGQTNASYTITVTNSGTAASSGAVTVTDPPTGFAIATMAGSGWTCTVSSTADSCTTSASVSAGQSLPAITVTGTVTSTSGTVSIPVNVEFNGTSSSASANVTLAPTVNFSVSPSSIILGSTANLSWSSTNAASCTPSGAWSGAIGTSGTQAVTPTAASLSIPGFLTYTLTCQNSASTTATGNAVLTVTYPAPAGRLTNVRSFLDVDVGGVDDPDGEASLIANSLTDLVVAGNSQTEVLNRASVDPTDSKLILGYTDVAEASSSLEPSLFSGSSLPSWFGNQNPNFPGVYTVQYWNPAWEPALFATIDETEANGYDGIFLDVADGDLEWSAGNTEGNPVYSEAASAMATLLIDIRSHVNTTYPGKNFYLIANDPTGVATANPSALTSLDVIYNEVAYYQHSGFWGNVAATGIVSLYAPAYATAGVPIFGNDYPQPLSDPSAALLSFELYSSLGWIPSVTNAAIDDTIFSTGPFMFTATPSNSTVTGYPNFVNFLSGGLAPNATLVGGNMGDYFIGGAGQNTITGGSGNDTIYAHPANAASKGALMLDFLANIEGTGSTPSVSVQVNGNQVIPATPITALYGSSGTTPETLQVSVPNSISSVQLTITNTSYTDSNDFSNLYIVDIIYNGVRINLGLGTYSNGHPPPYAANSGNGTVTFPGSAFDVVPQFLSNTSDVIDGGGGTNTVIYRGPSSNYTVTKQSNGSYLVTSASTVEGPDTLTNIQILQFSDTQMTLP